MKKVINIENQPVEVNSSMGWLFIYREQFGHDILPDILPLLDAVLELLMEIYSEGENLLEKAKEGLIDRIMFTLLQLELSTLVNMLWAMAKNADNSIDEPKTWANQFEVFPFDIVAKELFELLLSSSMSTKNSKSLQEKLQTIKSTSTNLSSLA